MDLANFYRHFRGSVICVQDGAIVHKGIIHSVLCDGCTVTVWIIDNNPHRGCVGYRTLEDFTGGQSAWLETPIQNFEIASWIISRAESQLGGIYDLITFNCEHFVTLALGGKPESGQLQRWGWLAVGVVGAIVVASKQKQPRRRYR